MDQNGEKYQLYGMSTHGIAWFPKYINYDAFLSLRDEWNTNCIRIAMYTDSTADTVTAETNWSLKTCSKGVDLATELGMSLSTGTFYMTRLQRSSKTRRFL